MSKHSCEEAEKPTIADRVEELAANLTADGEIPTKKSIAQMIDEALEQEFPEEKRETIGKNYNETAKSSDANLVTVLKISEANRKDREKEKEQEDEEPVEEAKPAVEEKPAKDEKSNKPAKPLTAKQQKAEAYKAFASPEASPPEAPAPAKAAKAKERKKIETNVEKEVDRIIDSQDNEYVLSRPKDTTGLTLDPQLIRDLTVLITSSTVFGWMMEAIKQPVINGYFIAGSFVGPGGIQMVKELVQVESLAQLGVQLLLFTLGLEFSMSKLRAVRSVALLGGMIEIFLFILVAGLLAHSIGASVHEGIFVGALVSMSSTSIVVKCLADTKSSNSPHGQITIGTLILQDCMVGLLFAFMPVLASNSSAGGGSDHLDVAMVVMRVTLSLGSVVLLSTLVARLLLPHFMRVLAKFASVELYQLTLISICLVSGWITGHLGLSTELGAFISGVMLSTTDQQEQALHLLENIKHFFMSLFISSTGLIMSPRFLLQHLPVLAGGVLLTVVSKTVLISGVVWMFRYPPGTALAVGLSMAQIGEFAFVLLSVASQLGLMPHQVYMLLMGVTAISLLLTPMLLGFSQKYLILAESDSPTSFLKVRHKRFSLADASMVPSQSEDDLERMSGSMLPTRIGSKERGSKMLPPGASAFPSENSLQQRNNFL
ncbi:hypothetical protein WJX74_001923 [Apatococcus lobatus]|uniref:Cation/H+ exchanger transmembrane domain-containing protein n=1 Tax=Apatococcus lobatus TaxID=904363 RepID=A0AAW1QIG4_9CHLO